VRVTPLDGGLAELCFDRQGECDQQAGRQGGRRVRRAVAAIAAAPDVRGVLVTSAKEVFIVGADITEFGRKF
jgi:3-hydroxyacyl-CoA dehydrogenase/enoyl-CoA hydratase/3-hydroxybutyryl-CoA epimerase/enoyl-CoA isomerase